MAKITYKEFMPVTGKDGTWRFSWVFTPPKGGWSTFDKYEIVWQYANKKLYSASKGTYYGVWMIGESTTYSAASDGDNYNPKIEYTPPDNARAIQVKVRPVSKTYSVTKNNNTTQVSYWTGEWYYSQVLEVLDYYNPDAPSTPTLAITDKNHLTASVTNYNDDKAASVRFEIEQTYNGSKSTSQHLVTLKSGTATYANNNATLGASYRVRAMGLNSEQGSKTFTSANSTYKETVVYGQSDWSDWSSSAVAAPSAPAGITDIRAESSTGIYVKWSPVTTADSYKIEWTDTQSNFDKSNASINSGETQKGTNEFHITGLDTGSIYFVRVCAVNDNGQSAWTAIKSCAVGKTPAAPTTWSNPASVAFVGETITFWFTHNSQDNSNMYYGQVEISTDGGETYIKHEVKGIGNDTEDSEASYSYVLDTSTTGWDTGATILWRARTAGITQAWGDYSAVRKIELFEQPSVTLTIEGGDGSSGTIASFPLSVAATALPDAQTAIGYHLNITSADAYEYTDATGETTYVSAGESVYSQYFDQTGNSFTAEIYPADIDLESGASYTATLTVSMDSGLTAQVIETFDVSWTDAVFGVDAQIGYDDNDNICYISPYAYATTDEELPSGIELRVYRRNVDGTRTLIAEGIEDGTNTAVVDMHPTLDYARYRIVGVDASTGAVSFTDMPGLPIESNYSIIQWNDDWESFDITTTEDESAAAQSSIIKLMYNPENSYSTNVSVSCVNYVGREYPVSYYGTAVDTSVSWKLDILRDDTETLYQLRRLQVWKGDVYVRDPSGFGCWATVNVSFERSYDKAVIPVTIDITRVEGGA